jgi:hypothetical protein
MAATGCLSEIHGTGRRLGLDFGKNPWSSSQKIRRKACEQCGDPECELALFGP